MTPARRVTNGLLAAGLCVAAAGCATPVGRYFERRGLDLGDCVEAEAGMGWPARIVLSGEIEGWTYEESAWLGTGRVRPLNGLAIVPAWAICCFIAPPRIYGRVKVTDFAVAGLGIADDSVRYGWRGRYRVRGMSHTYEAGIPLIRNFEAGGGTLLGGETLVDTTGPCLTTRRYEPEDLGVARMEHSRVHIRSYAPGRRGRVADRFWCGATATFLLSAKLDLNPAEFADFLAGCFGWDLLRDDDWEPKDEVTTR